MSAGTVGSHQNRQAILCFPELTVDVMCVLESAGLTQLYDSEGALRCVVSGSRGQLRLFVFGDVVTDLHNRLVRKGGNDSVEGQFRMSLNLRDGRRCLALQQHPCRVLVECVVDVLDRADFPAPRVVRVVSDRRDHRFVHQSPHVSPNLGCQPDLLLRFSCFGELDHTIGRRIVVRERFLGRGDQDGFFTYALDRACLRHRSVHDDGADQEHCHNG